MDNKELEAVLDVVRQVLEENHAYYMVHPDYPMPKPCMWPDELMEEIGRKLQPSNEFMPTGLDEELKALKCEYEQAGRRCSQAWQDFDDGKITEGELGDAVVSYDDFPIQEEYPGISGNALQAFREWKRNQRLKRAMKF